MRVRFILGVYIVPSLRAIRSAGNITTIPKYTTLIPSTKRKL